MSGCSGLGWEWGVSITGHEVSSGDDEDVLKLDLGDSCDTL